MINKKDKIKKTNNNENKIKKKIKIKKIIKFNNLQLKYINKVKQITSDYAG